MNEKCHVDPIHKTATAEERQAQQAAVLAVLGLGCPNCAARVRNSLVALRGVTEARVDHVLGLAEVRFNRNLTTVSDLIHAVARAGGDGRHEYRALLIEPAGDSV
jgi:copper chaperone CopZ